MRRDQNAYPRFSPVFSFRHGQSLATAVEAAIDAGPKPLEGSLAIRWDTARLTYESIPTEAEIETRLATGAGYEASYEKYLRQWDEKRLQAIRNGGPARPLRLSRPGGPLRRRAHARGPER